MDIYVIRHTRVDVEQGICYGQTDVPLATTFADELKVLQKKLPAQFDAVYSSPLSRCYRLATQFSEHVIETPALQEIHFGAWEMQSWDTIGQQALQAWADHIVDFSPPVGGESVGQLYQRVSDFLDMLRQQPMQQVLLVTHAGVMRCCWVYLLGFPLANSLKVKLDYGAACRLHLGAEKNADQLQVL